MSFFDEPLLPILTCCIIALVIYGAIKAIANAADSHAATQHRRADAARSYAEYVRLSAERAAAEQRRLDDAQRAQRIYEKQLEVQRLTQQIQLMHLMLEPPPPPQHPPVIYAESSYRRYPLSYDTNALPRYERDAPLQMFRSQNIIDISEDDV